MKRFLTGAAAVIIAASLAACGSDNTTNFVLTTNSPAASAAASASASAAATATPATSSGATGAEATPIPGGSKIIIDTPDASTSITSPVQVSGAASVANGTVVAVVLDAGGNELGRGTATASAAAPAFGHYDVTVSFSGAASGTKGQLKVYGVSTKDGTTPTNFYFISVRFP